MFGLFFIFQSALAECICTCIDGKNQPVCENSIDLKPICPPMVCPIEPPSVKPIMPPTIPPIGTNDCVQKQVFNSTSGQYEWETICQ